MYGAFQSEPVFAALYTLLAATQMLTSGVPNGTPAFLTSSRLAQAVSIVSGVEQPALYIMQGEIEFGGSEIGISTDEYKAAAIVYFRNTGGDTGLASPQLNALRDALIFQIRQRTLDKLGNIVPLILGERQTLGGLCLQCTFVGRALANEGLQNQQGAAVFPISILTGV